MNASFWKPKGFDIKSLFNFKFKLPNFKFEKRTPQAQSENLNVRKDYSSLYKKIGIVGGVVLSVIALLSALIFFTIVKPGYAVLASANRLKTDLNLLGEEFKKQDIDTIKTTLEVIKVDLNDIKKSRDENYAWARSFSLTRDYYSDIDHFVASGIFMCDALSEFVTVVTPFADAAGFKTKTNVQITESGSGSGLAEALATWVKVMPDVAGKMDGVIEKMDMVGEEMQKVDARRYPESIKGVAIRSNIEAVQQYLSKAKDFGPDIKAALTVIPQILGVGAEKRYAIIMQNNAEIRATGGFWTNYATFRIRNAMLNSDFTSKDMYSIDDIIATTDTAWTSPFLPPTPFYRDYLKVEHTYARDSNYYPDYTASVDAWMKYYKQAGYIRPLEAKPVNGVFAMDTEVIRRLLEVTGSVALNGVSYTPDNVIIELEKIASLSLKEQQGRKKVLGDLMEQMLVNMYKSERNLWPKFIETAVRLAVEKHVLAYVFDNPEAQKLLEKYNFAGKVINYDKGDYSYVVSSNLGGDKNNLFVTKNVVHNITSEGGKNFHEVVINYTFNDPKPGYEPLVSVYRDWVRVYAPAGSKLVSLEGSDAKTEADTKEEFGKIYFAGHLIVSPKETKTIKFKYELPASVVGDKVYNLYLQKQPGTYNDAHVVNIKGKVAKAELLTDKEVSIRF